MAEKRKVARLIASAIGGPIRGKLGNLVLVATPDGAIARTLTQPRNPRTPAQIAVRDRQTVCAQAWSDLDDEADRRWRAYARRLETSDPRTGTWTQPRPDNLFGALYSRMLLVDPRATPPQVPPEGAFFGDAIGVVTSDGASGVRFEAGGPNAAGVVTELLTQRLVTRKRRTYLEKYRHAAIVRFEEGHLGVEVPYAAGWVACAYRFIRADTGQATALAEIGVVRVD